MATPNQPEPESTGSVRQPVSDIKEPTKTQERATVGTKFSMRTEHPTEPGQQESAFKHPSSDQSSVGNPALTIELKEHGMSGYFYPRDRVISQAEAFEINPDNLFQGIYATIYSALDRLFQQKTELGDAQYQNRIVQSSAALAGGCCLTAYLKVRPLRFTEDPSEIDLNSLERPRAEQNLPIPTAYAFAIQQLGLVRIVDLSTDLRVYPRFPDTGHNYGIPSAQPWNPNQYARAVEYARSLGLKFNIVDLKEKTGTAWWLLKQTFEKSKFSLKCTYPETNFTNQMAITHCLFLLGERPDPTNAIIKLSDSTTTGDYGSMLRRPHDGINVSAFEALSDIAPEVWQHV